MLRPFILLSAIVFLFNACGEYRKGDKYSSIIPGDSLQYVIIARGNGKSVSEKAHEKKFEHESKGNICKIKYLSDSASLQEQKALLLFNSMLPDIQQDMLTKGFFGTFTSKQTVTLLLVSRDDISKFFK